MIYKTEQVEDVVAKEFEAEVSWFYTRERYSEVIIVRYALFWILRRIYKMTYMQIGKRYDFHLETVRYGIRVAQSLIDTDPIFKEKIDQIKEICFRK